MDNKEIIKELLERPIAYHSIIAKAFGSANLAILWSQLYYWTGRQKDPDGWIYKTREELREETGLSRYEQETARRIARDLGVWEEEKKGTPCKVHFRLDIEKSADILKRYLEKRRNQFAQKQQTCLRESSKQVGGKTSK